MQENLLNLSLSTIPLTHCKEPGYFFLGVWRGYPEGRVTRDGQIMTQASSSTSRSTT